MVYTVLHGTAGARPHMLSMLGSQDKGPTRALRQPQLNPNKVMVGQCQVTAEAEDEGLIPHDHRLHNMSHLRRDSPPLPCMRRGYGPCRHCQMQSRQSRPNQSSSQRWVHHIRGRTTSIIYRFLRFLVALFPFHLWRKPIFGRLYTLGEVVISCVTVGSDYVLSKFPKWKFTHICEECHAPLPEAGVSVTSLQSYQSRFMSEPPPIQILIGKPGSSMSVQELTSNLSVLALFVIPYPT